MATEYFRITATIPEKNISFVMDSYGAFEKIWEFSSFLISKGCKINHIQKIDITENIIPPLIEPNKKMVLRKI